MSRERLFIFDTTLRDGAQTNGVDFTRADKQIIASMLDDLGVDYVEGGYPGANPLDTEFFAEKPKLAHARFTAFGMTRRPGRSTSNDPGLAALLEAKADAICFVAKSSAYQVRVALETTNEENLASIRDSVAAAKRAAREVLLDCEHFFDGYKEDPEFALACAKAAYDAGARWVVLCDTNGGTMPHEVEAVVREVTRHISGDCVGIHAHNDTDQAVANSLAAVRAGARQIQGTLNGLGERCGNTNLCSLIPTLKLAARATSTRCRVSMMPVPRPLKRPLIACAYCRFGFMRVASSMNQARRWSSAWSAYLRWCVILDAAARAGTIRLRRIMARRCSTKLSGLLSPSR
jgi:2-isopropylmalate synthase